MITNRAQLLKAPTEGDDCAAFRAGHAREDQGPGDCESDGHYLCGECLKLAPSWWHRRGICAQDPTRCAECAQEKADGLRRRADRISQEIGRIKVERASLKYQTERWEEAADLLRDGLALNEHGEVVLVPWVQPASDTATGRTR